jgi:hypothetical protein
MHEFRARLMGPYGSGPDDGSGLAVSDVLATAAGATGAHDAARDL